MKLHHQLRHRNSYFQMVYETPAAVNSWQVLLILGVKAYSYSEV